MNDILILTNDRDEDRLVNFAYRFAYNNRKDLVVAKTSKPQPVRQLQLASCGNLQELEQIRLQSTVPHIDADSAKLPRLTMLNASGMTEGDLAGLVRDRHYAMVISSSSGHHLDMQILIDKLSCPLMLIPDDVEGLTIERMVYLCDIRFCQQSVLAKLTDLRTISLLLSHICLPGLPDLDRKYSQEVFRSTVSARRAKGEMFFCHITEKDVVKVVDTVINVLKADMLICQNRQYHFKQLLGEKISNHLPKHLSVPVLIFPC